MSNMAANMLPVGHGIGCLIATDPDGQIAVTKVIQVRASPPHHPSLLPRVKAPLGHIRSLGGPGRFECVKQGHRPPNRALPAYSATSRMGMLWHRFVVPPALSPGLQGQRLLAPQAIDLMPPPAQGGAASFSGQVSIGDKIMSVDGRNTRSTDPAVIGRWYPFRPPPACHSLSHNLTGACTGS